MDLGIRPCLGSLTARWLCCGVGWTSPLERLTGGCVRLPSTSGGILSITVKLLLGDPGSMDAQRVKLPNFLDVRVPFGASRDGGKYLYHPLQ